MKVKQFLKNILVKIKQTSVSFNVRVLPFSVTILSIIGMFFLALFFFSRYVGEQRSEALVISYQNLINEQENEIKSYISEFENVVEIRDAYRTHVKDLVELLYNRDMSYLAIGGSVPANLDQSGDEVTLLQLRNTISSMQDDLRLMGEVRSYLVARRSYVNNFPFTWPVKRNGVPRVSSYYGFRRDNELEYHPLLLDEDSGIHFHAGIDIPGAEGESIYATAAGRVYYTTDDHPLYGVLIILEHEYGLQTYYSHLASLNVKIGDEVKRGDIIGAMGATGRSRGVHLHYEIRRKDGDMPAVSIDPMVFLGTNF